MIGGVTTTVKTIHGSYDKDGNFYPGEPGRSETAPQPVRAAQELQTQAASMPVAWVTYPGATPPLKLKIRGCSEEMYQGAWRKYTDLFAQLSREQIHAYRPLINAEIYVLDWEGALYPNGVPIPFTPDGLAILLRNDPHLDAFLSDQVRQVSPKWSADLK